MNPGVVLAKVKAREWPSYHGHAVPLRTDPFMTGLDFVRALHHRLCQPLTALSCALELMLAGRENDEILTEQIQAAVSQSEKVSQIMGIFREMFEAEIESSSHELISLNLLLREITEELRPLAEACEVMVRVTGGQHEHQACMTQVSARQAIWGVLQHCIEVSAPRQEVTVCQKGSQMVICDGADVGHDEVTDAFDPFAFTANPATGNPVSNLPLALAQKLMQAANGELVVSATGHGRRFSLLFTPARSVAE